MLQAFSLLFRQEIKLQFIGYQMRAGFSIAMAAPAFRMDSLLLLNDSGAILALIFDDLDIFLRESGFLL